MRVLRDNILVKPLEREQLGSVIVPNSVEDEWKRGEVIQIGPEVKGEINEGDIIIFPPFLYGTDYHKVGNNGYIIVPEKIVDAII